MQTPFVKMHGLGNDFLIIRAADAPPMDSEHDPAACGP